MTVETQTMAVPEDTLDMRLVIARHYAGFTSAKAAALAVGVSGQTWRNWEAGKPMERKDLMLRHIAERMGVDYEWLRGGGPLTQQTGPSPDPNEGLETRKAPAPFGTGGVAGGHGKAIGSQPTEPYWPQTPRPIAASLTLLSFNSASRNQSQRTSRHAFGVRSCESQAA